MTESAPTTESSPSVLTEGAPADTASSQSVLDGTYASESQPTFTTEMLSEDLRNEPSLQNFNSLDNLAKSYVHARRMIGADPDEVLKIPKENDQEGWGNLYNRLGRPEGPDGYDFELGDGEQSNDLMDFKNVAHELGLSNNQAKMVLGIYNKVAEHDAQQEDQDYEQMNTDYLQRIQSEWGDSFDKNAELARRAFQNFASEEAVEVLKDTGLSNHPEILKTFARIGQVMAESDVLPGTRNQVGAPSQANAEDQISMRMQDQDFKMAYMDENNPGHEAAVREMTRLFSFTA